MGVEWFPGAGFNDYLQDSHGVVLEEHMMRCWRGDACVQVVGPRPLIVVRWSLTHVRSVTRGPRRAGTRRGSMIDRTVSALVCRNGVGSRPNSLPAPVSSNRVSRRMRSTPRCLSPMPKNVGPRLTARPYCSTGYSGHHRRCRLPVAGSGDRLCPHGSWSRGVWVAVRMLSRRGGSVETTSTREGPR
jgi:hypothetical protein